MFYKVITNEEDLPNLLFHGSHYSHNVIRPGFHYTNIEVNWDRTESNKFLYATTDKEAAIVLGLSSAVEKNFDMNSFHHKGRIITFIMDERSLSLSDILKLDLFLYTIKPTLEHEWIKANNQHNNIDTEYKTDNIINFTSKEQINTKHFFHNYEINIITKPLNNPSLENNINYFKKW